MKFRLQSLIGRIIAPLLCAGCFGSSLVNEASPRALRESDQVLLDRTPAVSGQRDVENRYLPTIRVTAKEKKDAEKSRVLLQGLVSPSSDCSGVLIHPRLVLTAGHCVCMMRSFTARSSTESLSDNRAQPSAGISRSTALKNVAVAAIIDSSECAKTAKVRTVIYEQPASGQESQRQVVYGGTVQPHPRLELLFNASALQVWGSADLAVIKLDEPVKDLPVFKLTTSEVQPGDSIVMVGYGPSGADDDTYGERHFGPNKVGWLRKLETGSVEFVAESQRQPTGSPSSHLFDGDSGGACLSNADQNVLVGIAASKAKNRRGEMLSVFTSVYAHRDWLTRQLKEL
jgi:hypothetical protein